MRSGLRCRNPLRAPGHRKRSLRLRLSRARLSLRMDRGGRRWSRNGSRVQDPRRHHRNSLRRRHPKPRLVRRPCSAHRHLSPFRRLKIRCGPTGRHSRAISRLPILCRPSGRAHPSNRFLVRVRARVHARGRPPDLAGHRPAPPARARHRRSIFPRAVLQPAFLQRNVPVRHRTSLNPAQHHRRVAIHAVGRPCVSGRPVPRARCGWPPVNWLKTFRAGCVSEYRSWSKRAWRAAM